MYKVGGSLFDWPDLFPRLSAFLRSEPGRPLLVSGGGRAADVVRVWDRTHRLGEARSHRLAVRSLDLGASFLADALGAAPDALGAALVCDRAQALAAWEAGQTAVLTAERFLHAEEAAGAPPLPTSWDVTSDSIAAWIAARWPADLVLLKSTSPQRASSAFVDPYFSSLRSTLRCAAWVDLRSGERGSL